MRSHKYDGQSLFCILFNQLEVNFVYLVYFAVVINELQDDFQGKFCPSFSRPQGVLNDFFEQTKNNSKYFQGFPEKFKEIMALQFFLASLNFPKKFSFILDSYI